MTRADYIVHGTVTGRLDPQKFLSDGRQFLWSAHSLDLAETCHRRYYYESVLNVATPDQNVHAFFGISVHKAVETYYAMRASGKSHDDTLRHIVHMTLEDTWDHAKGVPMLDYDTLKQLPGSAHLKTRENLIRTIIWYFSEYGDNDPCKTAILSNGQYAVELPFQFQLDDEIMLRGRLDRVVEFANDPYVDDSKTTGASISSFYFKRYDTDTEMSLYSLASSVVFKSLVKGVLITAMQIAVGFTRFERSATYRTEAQLQEWIEDAKYHIRMAWEAPKHNWPMRLSSCQKYGGCPFTGVCARDPRVREEYLATGFTKGVEQ